jgi:phosphoribosylglycinamide formyltransferase-1
MKKLAVFASYNGSVIEAIVEAIDSGDLEMKLVLIISNNTDAFVLQKANKLGIDTKVINKKTTSDPDKTLLEVLQHYDIEIIFLAGYMKKLSPLLTQNFTILNSHPSLLPKYGGKGMYGVHVHRAVLHNKEKESGVSVHYVNEAYDEGKILLQQKILLEANETLESLEKKIKTLEKRAVVDALKLCLK